MDYKQKSKTKAQEWFKLTANKKSLMTIIYGQCDDATRTKITLGVTYKVDHQAKNIINFLEQVHTVCFGRDNGGLSFKQYK